MTNPSKMTDAELNTAVAGECMGWTVDDAIPWEPISPLYIDGERTLTHSPFEWEPWSPATDIAAAFEVVERMRGTEDSSTWF